MKQQQEKQKKTRET